MEELVRYLKAILLLLMQDSLSKADKSGASPPKHEILLAEAGFSVREIALLVDKSDAAVAKAISRARAAKRKGSTGEPVSEQKGEE